MTTFIGGRAVSILTEQPATVAPDDHWCEGLEDLEAAGWLRRLAHAELRWAADLRTWVEQAQVDETTSREVFDEYWRQLGNALFEGGPEAVQTFRAMFAGLMFAGEVK